MSWCGQNSRAFVYGRNRTRPKADGSTSYTKLPREQWTLLKDIHPGYISWAQYEENLQRLRQNAYANGQDRRKSPPREGCQRCYKALLSVASVAAE